MEATFYERPASLDLGGPARGPLLSSPDLHMLKLESPELEKLIQEQGPARDFPDALCPLPPLYAPPFPGEEEQTVPRSPIDLGAQERLKLERKRLRNRIAASRCRRRKLERIARLEERVARLKGENAELAGRAARLRDHVARLERGVAEHVRAGCEVLPL